MWSVCYCFVMNLSLTDKFGWTLVATVGDHWSVNGWYSTIVIGSSMLIKCSLTWKVSQDARLKANLNHRPLEIDHCNSTIYVISVSSDWVSVAHSVNYLHIDYSLRVGHLENRFWLMIRSPLKHDLLSSRPKNRYKWLKLSKRGHKWKIEI